MFANLDRVTYQVPDIEKARDWYSRILNKEPVIDSPFITVFKISDFLLILVPEPDSSPGGGQPPVAYWGVDDIHTAYQRLLEFGAAAHTEISINVFNSRVAKVVDPFGNIIGITGKASDTDKSLEDQPSDTALTTVFCRALAACERRDEVKGPDYLAEIFIDEEGKKTLRDPAAREWVMKNLMKGGVYEYFIARTAYIDHIVKQAFQENIPQVVFLGAGYDTRSYRFQSFIKETKIFELDIESTQQRKRKLLKQAGVTAPEQLTFVSINFEKDDLSEVLNQAGFDGSRKSLFIWEGVTYYLSPEAVDDTLKFIRLNSAAGSAVCFDYMVNAPDIADRYGVKETRESMKSIYLVEHANFCVDEGEIETFLLEQGFKMLDHLTAEDMEKKYLTLRNGELAGKVTALFRIVCASA